VLTWNRSWLELPEALTALLIPLPYVFASLAYPSVVAQARRLPTSPLEMAAESETLNSQVITSGGQFLHACTLSSTTLLLVGIIAKIRSSFDQPLDRRKPEPSGKLLSISSIWRMSTNAMSVLLPFYATMQLGGARTALVLLTAATGGLGGFDQGPGRYSALENTKRTLRTRKWTWTAILLIFIADMLTSGDAIGTLFGYLALVTSMAAVPLPLPTAGWFIMTKPYQDWNTQNSTRASLPKPSSPLVNTPQDTVLTLASGFVLTLISVLYSSVAASSPSLSHFSITFSTFSVVSAAALVYFSLPSALRSQNKAGLALSGLLVAACGVWEHIDLWQAWFLFPLSCALVVGAVIFDTRSSASRPHSHGHSHAGASHEHDHHLHGNHSKLSAFLIARCEPGSILHSILIERDSRRIAYFGV
jgi:zinc transporter 5/7